ncbi:hypothetical protein AK830_g2377 [Neonectria ditissima]|uniref:DUF7779 domain-containing protein n=1 Tax=Neonectria ditissima TaxID=78410 RepID=A0A0P7BSB7_9HYPO|nr:hypothetical protein AK830_g2377 [Neonectria ditissima]
MPPDITPNINLCLTSKHIFTTAPGITVDIIVIPAPGSAPVTEWGVEGVLTAVKGDHGAVSSACTYYYNYSEKLYDTQTWESFLDLGNSLLDALLARKELDSPDVGILGSLFSSLNAARLRREHFASTLNRLLGIVFLGTPHSARHDQETWEKHVLIAQALHKKSRATIKSQNSARDSFSVNDLGVQFEKLALSVPVLSVYDDGTITLGSTPGLPPDKASSLLHRITLADIDDLELVDENLARTGLTGETLICADAEHLDLCRLVVVSGMVSHVSGFFRRLFGRAKRENTPASSVFSSLAPTPGSSVGLLSLPTPRHGITPSVSESDAASSSRSTPSFCHVSNQSYPVIQRPSLEISPFKSPEAGGLVDQSVGAELPCRILPRYTPNPDFFGRGDELQQLDQHLKPLELPPNAQIPRQFAVCGMGGVGKTELVVEWVYKQLPLFQAMFWVDAAEPSQLAASYAKIAPELGLVGQDQAPDLVANREIAKRFFHQTTLPWLLVFDNADNVDSLSDYWPSGAAGSILVSSRDPFAKSYHSFSMPGLNLEPFPEKEAAEFVGRITACENTDEENQACHEMALQLGCLPLAIIQMAGVIRRRQWTIHEFVVKFKQDSRYRGLRSTGNNPQLNRYGNTLVTAWNFDDLSPSTLYILRLISILSPDCIQEHLLLKAMHNFDLEVAGDVEDAFDDAKEALLSSSIIKRNKISKELSIHRIIAQEVRARLTPDALYLHERGFSFRGKPYLENALELYKTMEDRLGDSAHLLSDIYYTLGAIANEINDGPGCLRFNLILLEMRKTVAEKANMPDVRLAAAHSQMGIAYMMTGKLALATEYFKHSVALFRSLNDFQVDMLGFPMANLGLAYWIQGQLDEADATFAEALSDREKTFGKMDKVSYKTGRILHGYGNVKASQAEAAKATGDDEAYDKFMEKSRKLHEASLAQLESTLEQYHHRVADLCHRIAGHCILRGDHETAQEYLDRALRIWGNKAWYRNQVARTSFLKGKHLVSLGGKKADEGQEWLMQAAVLRKEILHIDPAGEPTEQDYDELVRAAKLGVRGNAASCNPYLDAGEVLELIELEPVKVVRVVEMVWMGAELRCRAGNVPRKHRRKRKLDVFGVFEESRRPVFQRWQPGQPWKWLAESDKRLPSEKIREYKGSRLVDGLETFR